MFTTMICVGLMHAAVDAGSADGARSSSVVGGVCSVKRVLAMPGHDVMARVSSDSMHSVVYRGSSVAGDQELLPVGQSGPDVNAIPDGSPFCFLAMCGEEAEGGPGGLEVIHPIFSRGEYADELVASVAELRQ